MVRRRADGKFELIAGERRTRAAILAGLKKIPVILADADDRKAAEMGVIENPIFVGLTEASFIQRPLH